MVIVGGRSLRSGCGVACCGCCVSVALLLRSHFQPVLSGLAPDVFQALRRGTRLFRCTLQARLNSRVVVCADTFCHLTMLAGTLYLERGKWNVRPGLPIDPLLRQRPVINTCPDVGLFESFVRERGPAFADCCELLRDIRQS